MTEFTTKPMRERARNLSEGGSSESRGDSNPWVLRISVVVALVGLLWMNVGLLKPLLMAGLFAATLYPFYLKLEKKIPIPSVRAAVLTFGFAILFLLPIGAVAFLAASAGLKKFKDLPDDWTDKLQIEPLLRPILSRLEGYLPMDQAEMIRHLEQVAITVGKTGLSWLQGLVADLPKLTIINVVILFGIYVLLVEAKRVLAWLRRISPLSESKTDRLFNRIGGLSSSSVLATIVSGFVQACIIGVVLLVMQVPGALLITMSAFVFSFVPIIGTAPVAIYLIGSAALAGDWTNVIVFVITAGVVGVSDNIVRPFVLSDAGKLHGFVAFVAAIGALETMGFYGLFLGPVVAGAVFTLVELVHEKRTA